jgi:hypothetical protein
LAEENRKIKGKNGKTNTVQIYAVSSERRHNGRTKRPTVLRLCARYSFIRSMRW